jgi:SAM-dependent methyltransferase
MANQQGAGNMQCWMARQPLRQAARTLYLRACERLYHEFAWSYEWVAAGVSLGGWQHWRRAALAHVNGSHVLELGPGPGALLAELQPRVPFAMGLEHSAQMMATALRQTASSRLPLVQGDARAIPLAGGQFDTVLSTFPAPYLLEAETLREVARVLRPGGRLVVMGLWVTGPAWRLHRQVEEVEAGAAVAAGAPRRLLDMAEARLSEVGLQMTALQERVCHRLPVGGAVATVGGFVAIKAQRPDVR